MPHREIPGFESEASIVVEDSGAHGEHAASYGQQSWR